jgi:transposase
MANSFPQVMENKNPHIAENKIPQPAVKSLIVSKERLETLMVNKQMYMKIKKMKKLGKSKSQVSRELSLDRKTVSKYYEMSDEEYRQLLAESMYREKIFEPYMNEILKVYDQNNNQPLHVSSVYDYLEEQHGRLPGSERTLRNFIRYLLATNRLEFNGPERRYTQVPELPPGKQLQLDFGQYKCSGGLMLYIFAAVLSSSRYKYAIFQERPFTTLDVISHLLSCFDSIGGIPEELVIDQDKVMVVSENHGDIVYTENFRYFIEEMNLEMYVCRKADPESKGKIENTIKFIKHNFLQSRDFASIEEANAGLHKWLERRANGKISQATGRIPAIMFTYEKEYLKPLRNSIFRKDSLAGREIRQVNEKCQVSVQASLYALPSKYKNRKVEVYITERKLFVYDEYTGSEIVEYDLSLIPGRIVSKRGFSRHTERSLRDLKQVVTNISDSVRWREFIKKNFKSFPRYVRDQCNDAIKYFAEDRVDLDILDEAAGYCLENRTFSFANLHDTYLHFSYLNEKGDSCPCSEVPEVPALQSSRHKAGPLHVAKRAISFYEDVARAKEAAQ